MTTNDGITTNEQYAAACRYQNGFMGHVDPITAFMSGSEWARARLRTADPRPLTPDAITDKMVERAQKAIAEKSGGDFTPGEVRTYNILAAALTEPPARPEGAEEWEDWLIETMPHESMPDEDIARLADQIAARVVGEDGAR